MGDSEEQARDLNLTVLVAVGAERAAHLAKLLHREKYPPDQVTVIALMHAATLLAREGGSAPTENEFLGMARVVFASTLPEEGEAAPPPNVRGVAFEPEDLIRLGEIVRTYDRACEAQPEDKVVIEKVNRVAEAFRAAGQG